MLCVIVLINEFQAFNAVILSPNRCQELLNVRMRNKSFLLILYSLFQSSQLFAEIGILFLRIII